MKNFLLVILGIFIAVSGSAQSQKAKEKFMKSVFEDFKNNRLENISGHFVDSVFLIDLIAESKKRGEDIPERFTTEEIQEQRTKAEAQFLKSLQRAYKKYTENGLEKELAKIKPRAVIKEKAASEKVPFQWFAMHYKYEIDDNEVALKISQVLYDAKRKRFAIMSKRARHYFIPNVENISVSERVDTLYEKIEMRNDEIVKMPSPPAVSEERVKAKSAQNLAGPKQDKVLQFVEKMPEFPGGQAAMMKFIVAHIQYPELARENGVEGRVFTRFTVWSDGSLGNFEILRSIGGGCDQEALRVLKMMPKWKPGMQRGKPVSVRFTLPFVFKLK